MKGKLVIMKPVSITCNQRCDYCYNLSVNFRTERSIPKMSLRTAELIQRELIKMGTKRIRFVWHGGEPLLRGLQFYKDIVVQQAKLHEEFPNVHIKNGMQSNLTLLTPEWCEFFKKNDFRIGSSLDGWEEIHNAHRKYPDGRGTFDDVMRGIKLAQDYGIMGGVIAVINNVTVQQDPIEFFNWITKVCPRTEISPCWEVGMNGKDVPDYIVNPYAFLKFAKAMFDAWWAKDNPKIEVRMFHGFVQALLGGKDFTCSFKGNCSDFLSIEADGSVYPCGKFSGIPEYNLGNINKQPLDKILTNPLYQCWLDVRKVLPQECQSCKWAKVCNNGCTYERYLGNNKFTALSPYCDVWAELYEYIDNHVNILQKALIDDKQ